MARTSLYSTKNPNRVLCSREKLTGANSDLLTLAPKLVDVIFSSRCH